MELPFASSDACGHPERDNSALNAVVAHESPTERAKSRETSPNEHHVTDTFHVSSRTMNGDEFESDDVTESSPVSMRMVKEVDAPVEPVFCKVTLEDVAKERVNIISERMRNLPGELIEELKADLRAIIEGTGGSQHIEQFSLLRNIVEDRSDLTWENLIRAHQVQLEILVAIKTGIGGFLHPTINLSLVNLVEIFLYERCRNIACRNPLPAHDCNCEKCTEENGFCNCCMCVVCNRFDSEANNCHWIGCEGCPHWTHTDCATCTGLIEIGRLGNKNDALEVSFKCQVCNHTSDVLGWLKEVFQSFAPGWDRDELLKQLGTASRIFQGSLNPRGKKLYHKFVDLIEQVKIGNSELAAFVFQELEMDLASNSENDERVNLFAPQEACNRLEMDRASNLENDERVKLLARQEACNRITQMVRAAVRNYKRARLSSEECNSEVEDMHSNLKRPKRQLDDIESLIRLKLAEAEMYQLKSQEAKAEAERLQKFVLSKSEITHQDFASLYLKRRLCEVEAEKQKLERNSRMAKRDTNSSEMQELDKLPTLEADSDDMKYDDTSLQWYL